MQLINLKLLSKFHEARPNRSRVISKSLKFHSRQFKNGRVKTKEHATRASIVSFNKPADNLTNDLVEGLVA